MVVEMEAEMEAEALVADGCVSLCSEKRMTRLK